jgi:hypothetical protein
MLAAICTAYGTSFENSGCPNAPLSPSIEIASVTWDGALAATILARSISFSSDLSGTGFR